MSDNSLAEIFRQLKQAGKCPAVTYELGSAPEDVTASIEEVKDDCVKILGHHWLAFVNIIGVFCGGMIIYPKPEEVQERDLKKLL